MPTDNGRPLLIDTHFWLWTEFGDRRATPRVFDIIQAAANRNALLVSVISVWEIALLEAKHRVELFKPCDEWIREALATPGLRLAPLTPEIAIASTRLPGILHGDPADRIIVATARHLGAALLTKDRGLLEYGEQGHVALAAV
jgi:PIN domain nuclease of toxin-antitoxin system